MLKPFADSLEGVLHDCFSSFLKPFADSLEDLLHNVLSLSLKPFADLLEAVLYLVFSAEAFRSHIGHDKQQEFSSRFVLLVTHVLELRSYRLFGYICKYNLTDQKRCSLVNTIAMSIYQTCCNKIPTAKLLHRPASCSYITSHKAFSNYCH